MNIKVNPNNPRIIKDDNFKKLVQSIKDFPEMLDIRPIVVNKEGIILGGNMRYKACLDAGIKEPPYVVVDLTEEQQKEFLIKDNVSGGDWDWDVLASEWNAEELKEWGLEVWQSNDAIDLNDFFEENNEEKEQKFKIVLDYSEEDYNNVIDAFGKHSGSKEDVIYKLLIQ